MIYITERPERYVDIAGTQSGFLSRWNTIHNNNSLKYKVQRKDYNVIGIWDGGTYVMALIWTLNLDVPMVLGDYVYVNSPPYVGLFQIVNNSGLGGVAQPDPNTHLVEINAATGQGNSTGGYMNLPHKNYYLDIKVYGFKPDDITLAFPHIAGLTAVPQPTGECHFDVSTVLRKFLSFGNCNYNLKVWNDYLRWIKFTISIQEKWKGGESQQRYDVVSENDETKNLKFFAVNAAKQIGEKYGVNMAENVPFDDVDEVIQITDKAKFLNDFTEPTYFLGYPFSLTFINSEQISGHELYRVEQKKNINKANSGTAVDTLLDATQNYGVCELMLAGGYSSNIPFVDVWLKIGDEVEDAYVEDDYWEDEYSEGGNITPSTPGRVTEVKTVRIKHCTYANPIHIRWFGTNGGANYYLFDRRGEKGKKHTQQTYKPFNEDIETATATDIVYEKNNENYIMVGAFVDENDLEGLLKMREAIKIEYLKRTTAISGGYQYYWQEISLNPGNMTVPTPFRTGEVEFVFELPNTITQRQ